MDKNIQYILEVARCGGITKAANKLYITPSALSRFVQARESELNVLLFHRVGKRFIPTEAGKYYIQKCQEIEQLQLELNQQMQHFANISNKVIQIGVQPSFSTVVLDKVLPAFRKTYPDMKIVLQEYSAANLMEMLRRQEVDVILATTDNKILCMIDQLCLGKSRTDHKHRNKHNNICVNKSAECFFGGSDSCQDKCDQIRQS